MNKLNIIGIKCKDCFFVTNYESKNSWNKYNSLNNFIINDKEPEKTFDCNWNKIEKEPIKIQQYESQPVINKRYELMDKTLISEKIPEILKYEDVIIQDDDDCIWKDIYRQYKSLYEYKYDIQPDILIDIEFQYKTILEVEEIKEYNNFNYRIPGKWKDEVFLLSEKDIGHQLLDKIIFPEIILPSKLCELTQQQSYNIVRQYVKENIDLKVAEITSDYDFCFTVKKKIKLSKDEEYQVDVNNSYFQKRKRKPKLETRYRKYNMIECFNMAPNVYNNYKVIQGFKGKDQDDLKNNIDDYLKNLIEYINEPLEECPHCKGLGVIFNEGLKTKKEQ